MSKQLAISASFSIFAMAAFALFATPQDSQRLFNAQDSIAHAQVREPFYSATLVRSVAALPGLTD